MRLKGLHQPGADSQLALIGFVLCCQGRKGACHVVEAQPAKRSQWASIGDLAITDFPGEVIDPRFGQH